MDSYQWDNNEVMGIGVAVALVVVTIGVLSYKKNQDTAAEPIVSELNIYPIKSCAEVRVDSAKITKRGFQYDRIAQVCKQEDGSFCTPRDEANAKLFHVKPTIASQNKLELTAPSSSLSPLMLDLSSSAMKELKTIEAQAMERSSPVQLRDFGNEASEWMTQATGITKSRIVGYNAADDTEFERNVQVNNDQGEAIPMTSDAPVSLADEAPFLLTSESSLKDLNQRMKQRNKPTVDMRRFRPNIVLKGLRPWQEDCWKTIQIGDAQFHVWQRCGRCRMTTIDRDSLKYSGEPLNTLSTFRERANGQRNFGMHLIPLANSTIGKTISKGDKVTVLEYDEERLAEWKKLFG